MPYVRGFLNIVSPDEPDNSLPGGGGYPDNGLPGAPSIDNSLPKPPPGVWPPPVPAHPIVPAPPGTPPGSIWPSPARPDNTLPSPPDPSQPPPVPTPPIASGPQWVLVWIPGYGWHYVVVDPSAKPEPK